MSTPFHLVEGQMTTLRICLFGSVRISHARWDAEVKITRAVQTLLAYLLLYRHRIHPREVLVGLFWGEYSEERARSCLSTTLWRLRRALEPGDTTKGTYLVTTPTNEVGFNRESDHWLDVAVFEEQVNKVVRKSIKTMEPHDAGQLENALNLHIGELLEGFHEDWALRERERLRFLYLESLAYLMRYYGYHGDYEHAIACGNQILSHDPLREEVHREVMKHYLLIGQRAQAIRQYKICCRILDKELGIPPMEETQILHRELIASRPDQAARSALQEMQGLAPSKEQVRLEQALQKLTLATQHFRKAEEKLHRAVRLLEGILKRN
jgi:DNA-binding SARP family transcriptional activator